MQAGVAVHRKIWEEVFGLNIATIMPRRVLPLSTIALSSIEVLFDEAMQEVRKLLQPGRRRRRAALATLRPLAIMNRAVNGEEGQPSDRELEKLADRVKNGDDWRIIFNGVNLIECVPDGDGPTVSLQIVKKDGLAIRFDPHATGAVGVKRVNELDYYNLSSSQMANHLDITGPKFFALSRHLGLEGSEDYFKLIIVGQQRTKRYSQKGLQYALREVELLSPEQWETVWENHRPRRRGNPFRETR